VASECEVAAFEFEEVAFEFGAGGIRVRSGGIRVRSGGIRVRSGGIRVRSGGIRVRSGGIRVRSGGIRVRRPAGASRCPARRPHGSSSAETRSAVPLQIAARVAPLRSGTARRFRPAIPAACSRIPGGFPCESRFCIVCNLRVHRKLLLADALENLRSECRSFGSRCCQKGSWVKISARAPHRGARRRVAPPEDRLRRLGQLERAARDSLGCGGRHDLPKIESSERPGRGGPGGVGQPHLIQHGHEQVGHWDGTFFKCDLVAVLITSARHDDR